MSVSEQAKQALRAMDFPKLLTLANISREHDARDRLILFQELAEQVDQEDLGRYEDATDILIVNPELAAGIARLKEEVDEELQIQLGPFYPEVFDSGPVIFGYFLTPSLRGASALWQMLLPSDLVSVGEHPQELPPQNYMVAMCLKIVEVNFPADRFGVEVRHNADSRREPCTIDPSCSKCGGRGRIACSRCGGSGVDDSKIQRAISSLNPQQFQELQRLSTPQGIAYLDLKRVLGSQINCDACHGEGGRFCSCVGYLVVPLGFREGWICRTETASEEILSHRIITSVRS